MNLIDYKILMIFKNIYLIVISHTDTALTAIFLPPGFSYNFIICLHVKLSQKQININEIIKSISTLPLLLGLNMFGND